jgi:predicted nuclease of restriction endonuclease-like (RecB) superfamily
LQQAAAQLEFGQMTDLIYTSKSYQDLLVRLKSQIQTARVRAALAVNQELVLLYWRIGKEILTRQKEEGWGAGVIERLGKDLRHEFPSMQGLSPRNLKYTFRQPAHHHLPSVHDLKEIE